MDLRKIGIVLIFVGIAFTILFIGNDNEQIMLCNWRSNWKRL